MDGKAFDDLARGLGGRRTRRAAFWGLAGGLLGLGLGRGEAAAQDGAVGAEGCRVRRCKKRVLGQDCTNRRGRPVNNRCCQGLKCDNRRGTCVFKNGHGGAGDFCANGGDCDRGYFCKKNQCIPDSCQS
jgi:hypothetical protein